MCGEGHADVNSAIIRTVIWRVDHFPQGERVAFRILADHEVTHPGHSGFGLTDGPAELLDFCGGLGHRGHGDIVGDGLRVDAFAA